MSTTSFKGQPAHTVGKIPAVGQNFTFSKLVKNDLSEVNTDSYAGKYKVLNIFPSIDTGVCAASVRRFNKEAANLKNTVVLCISQDLPFANSRFCGAEGIANCDVLSAFRSNFGTESGLTLADTVLAGLLARSVIVLSPENKIIYTELVSDIAHEPNYDAALNAVR